MRYPYPYVIPCSTYLFFLLLKVFNLIFFIVSGQSQALKSCKEKVKKHNRAEIIQKKISYVCGSNIYLSLIMQSHIMERKNCEKQFQSEFWEEKVRQFLKNSAKTSQYYILHFVLETNYYFLVSFFFVFEKSWHTLYNYLI